VQEIKNQSGCGADWTVPLGRSADGREHGVRLVDDRSRMVNGVVLGDADMGRENVLDLVVRGALASGAVNVVWGAAVRKEALHEFARLRARQAAEMGTCGGGLAPTPDLPALLWVIPALDEFKPGSRRIEADIESWEQHGVGVWVAMDEPGWRRQFRRSAVLHEEIGRQNTVWVPTQVKDPCAKAEEDATRLPYEPGHALLWSGDEVAQIATPDAGGRPKELRPVPWDARAAELFARVPLNLAR
jgi:hypothetical protein